MNMLEMYMEMTGQNNKIQLDYSNTTIEVNEDPMRMETTFLMRTQYNGRRYASSLRLTHEELTYTNVSNEFIANTLERNLTEAIKDGTAWIAEEGYNQ